MNIEINGVIKLYSILKEDIELIDTEIVIEENKEETNEWYLAYNRDYYIGYSDTNLEAITPSNFKRIAKKYFASAPELAASIGKRGFRYKNLPAIILYFNKQITEGKALIKEDKLTVKQISSKIKITSGSSTLSLIELGIEPNSIKKGFNATQV